MPLPGITPKTQSDLVDQNMKDVTDILKLPGIEALHTKPVEEIAAVLANLLKSRVGITSLKFVVGSHVEVTVAANPFNQSVTVEASPVLK